MYPSSYVPQAALRGRKGSVKSAQNDWSFVEICIECKTEPEALDPFDDRNDDGQPTSKDRKGVLGQILSYAEFVLTRQQRTCVFMILLLGDLCRLVRFDRSGAIASQKFNYKTNGGDLIEFLWRYARCDTATRGHDPSAERISPDSELGKKMQDRATKKAGAGPEDYVREMFEESLKTDWSWWKLRVDGERGVVRHFLVGEPNFQAPGVAGRGTRGYVALDADNLDGPFYYLKDAWRVVSRHIDEEGNILQFLNKKGVQYIPTLECHGDIMTPTTQLTKTNQLWKDLHRRKKGAVCPFKKHQHYRIAVKEVGQEMAKFDRGRQLIHALWCCIYAHSQAYKAGIIHRDISAGNLLRYFDQSTGQWCGLLNDWEMSKNTNSKRPEGRQLDRTGTWQFMSAAALEAPTKQIAAEDELESFFHVLLFLAIRFLRHNCDNVADFMHAYFDDFSTLNTGRYGCGNMKMLCMTNGRIAIKMDGGTVVSLLEFIWPPSADNPAEVETRTHPMNKLLQTILGWLQAHYSLMPVANTSADKTAPPAPTAAAEESDDEEDLLLAGRPPRDPK
ncbi:uncharacterized protein TRAVEDRAFT_131991 [Trametes versicolor FP-101664 SS1]|uniref:uncharacterized protein n=1 Tax=Trametes versicolor (strain FP-101664) TaxID=717944 RepID=UPI0004622651|nr:uncharacterized protein TRAVEDRAFT_131991 [Trametes versicolor FP-101664 SS1]EIW54026.1 hypothetical protein TRAVEDRAFT_131991 [Trametes versicolor FP-101664 SS1]